MWIHHWFTTIAIMARVLGYIKEERVFLIGHSVLTSQDAKMHRLKACQISYLNSWRQSHKWGDASFWGLEVCFWKDPSRRHALWLLLFVGSEEPFHRTLITIQLASRPDLTRLPRTFVLHRIHGLESTWSWSLRTFIVRHCCLELRLPKTWCCTIALFGIWISRLNILLISTTLLFLVGTCPWGFL